MHKNALGLAIPVLMVLSTPGFCAGYDDLNAGIQARNRGNWDGAIESFDKALAENDLVPDQQFVAHQDRALARRAKGDIDGAIADLNACLDLRPRDKISLGIRKDIEIAAGRLDAARQDLDILIADNPNEAESYLERGQTYGLQGELEKAQDDFQVAHTKAPADPRISLMIGINYFMLKRPDEAVAAFEESRSAREGFKIGWLWDALVALEQNKPPAQMAPFTFMVKSVWPNPLVEFFQGEIGEDAVRAAAAQGDPADKSGRLCDAVFFVGEWRFVHGDKTGGKSVLEEAVHSCPPASADWYAAKMELVNAS